MSDGIKFDTPEGDHRKVATSQRRFIESIAQGIEKGESLADLQRIWAAGILRAYAKQIPDKPKGTQGPARKFDHGEATMAYAMKRYKGMPHGEALADLADETGASEVALDNAIKKQRKAAFAMLGIPDPGNQS